MNFEVQHFASQGPPSLVDDNFENEGLSTKKTRGPTRALQIHGLTENNSNFILLNTRNQPIGPTDEAVNNLSTFLGTLARNAMLAPLVYVDWRAMPQSNQNDMWDLVKAKFDIKARAKKWVLSTIATDWRNYKC
ncbi:hypothetical protein QQP08_022773 [Theobroma cacao]|nr:hypothetical protein QQP08_022773 [Theobroma cacao]